MESQLILYLECLNHRFGTPRKWYRLQLCRVSNEPAILIGNKQYPLRFLKNCQYWLGFNGFIKISTQRIFNLNQGGATMQWSWVDLMKSQLILHLKSLNHKFGTPRLWHIMLIGNQRGTTSYHELVKWNPNSHCT